MFYARYPFNPVNLNAVISLKSTKRLFVAMAKKIKRLKKTIKTTSKFKLLVLPRPDILHGYLRHEQINQYLDYVATRFSKFVRVHEVGLSHEKRPVKAIEIDWRAPRNMMSLPKEAKLAHMHWPRLEDDISCLDKLPKCEVLNAEEHRARNIVLIEGGTHAREWLTVSVALNCIYQLTEKSIRNRELLRKMRFFIVPLVNPDGYEYTMTTNPSWRKNRKPNENEKSIGTDCNRNYDFHWDQGSSKSTRNTYKGDKPFSEPETCALRNILHKLAPQLLFVLSLHSYAQCIMYPWGYCKEHPEHWLQLQRIASVGRDAIRAYSGRNYRIGSISGVTKRCIAGSIVDYAYGVVKVPVALVIELPGHSYGFQPSADVINPIGMESWIGIRSMCMCALDVHNTIKTKATTTTTTIAAPSKIATTTKKPTTTTTTEITTKNAQTQYNLHDANLTKAANGASTTVRPTTINQILQTTAAKPKRHNFVSTVRRVIEQRSQQGFLLKKTAAEHKKT